MIYKTILFILQILSSCPSLTFHRARFYHILFENAVSVPPIRK